MGADAIGELKAWPKRVKAVTQEKYLVPGAQRDVTGDNYTTSLSGSQIPKIAVPRAVDWGEILAFVLNENLPGAYPYTAAVYPYRREQEDPTRMFAGEGPPERTNRRFHYVAGDHACRTAVDGLRFHDAVRRGSRSAAGHLRPHRQLGRVDRDARRHEEAVFRLRPVRADHVGVDDDQRPGADDPGDVHEQCDRPARRALPEERRALGRRPAQDRGAAGADRASAVSRSRSTRVELPEGHDGSGLALLGVTGDQLVEREVYERIKAETLSQVRGTVQADILKEDQAQNTCIFSTEFAMRMMGDVQQYFIDHGVRNFYSVSISGYHIAEAGANPISQLAFTLANGFTIVEYYLARGMKIDDFAPNLSFFFSNGMDPEYAVIGRVARRIWARAMRELYKASPRSQMLKYHIQTSGRSLHAREISFNDIRTTLQAMYALFDNCNSLHTNAYDEALTTPTEESVRRAVAIQMIINRELGLNKNQNPWAGSYIIDALTDLVEEAIYKEFEAISERGGVLGAMETMYQRSKIQEESLYYETKKHDGSLPIIGVNTFLSDSDGSQEHKGAQLIRSTEEEKQDQVSGVRAFQARNADRTAEALKRLQAVAASRRQRVRAVDGSREVLLARPDLAGAVSGRRAVSPQHVKAVGLYRNLPIDDPESLVDLDVPKPAPAAARAAGRDQGDLRQSRGLQGSRPAGSERAAAADSRLGCGGRRSRSRPRRAAVQARATRSTTPAASTSPVRTASITSSTSASSVTSRASWVSRPPPRCRSRR